MTSLFYDNTSFKFSCCYFAEKRLYLVYASIAMKVGVIVDKTFMTELRINHVRHLKDITIPLSESQPKHLILTGKNGSGKTSVLKSAVDFLSYAVSDNFVIQSDCLENIAFDEQRLQTASNSESGKLACEGIRNSIAHWNKFLSHWADGVVLAFPSYLNLREKYLKGEYILAYYGDDREIKVQISKNIEKVDLQEVYSLKDHPSQQLVKYLVNLKTTEAFAKTNGNEARAAEIHAWFDRFQNVLRSIYSDDTLELKFDIETFSLAITRLKIVLADLDACPKSTLKEHPIALLVLMRCMFNWHQIPKMLELKNLLLETVKEHPAWPGEYRSNLLGECDLITSFLFYNDIAAMSVLHRSASEKMTRPAISIQKANGWTFNSPSVLMMYHSKPGALDAELAEIDRCMPHYCKITDNHGIGADRLMQAEAAFTRGQLDDAMIALERTYAQTDGSGQENIALCGDFLSLRLSLFGQGAPRYTPLGRYELLQQQHNAPWVRFWDACCAYYYALLGQEEAIPEPFRLHRLEGINFLAPGRPMILLIENQVYLTQKAWPKVIGRSEKLLEGAAAFRYSLVALYLRIQTAAAYAMMAKQTEAAALLQETLQ